MFNYGPKTARYLAHQDVGITLAGDRNSYHANIIRSAHTVIQEFGEEQGHQWLYRTQWSSGRCHWENPTTGKHFTC